MSFLFLSQDKLDALSSSLPSLLINDEQSPLANMNTTLEPIVNATCDYFCKDDEGWGPISKVYFDFTICAIDGFFFTLANLFLIIIGGKELLKIRSQHGDLKFRKSWSYFARILLVTLQFGLNVTLSIYFSRTLGFNDWKFIQPTFESIALIIGVFLHHFDYLFSEVVNSSILFYHLLIVLSSILRFLNLQLRDLNDEFYYILTVFTLLNSTFILLVSWLAKKPQTYQPVSRRNPYDYATFFSLLTFSWMTPLMRKGYSQYLTEDDLPPLPNAFKSKVISESFEKYWQRRVNKSSNPSLGRALLDTFGLQILLGGAFKVIQDILQFTQPMMLKFLIQFVNTYNSDTPEPISKGFMIVLGMFAISVIQTLLVHQYFWNVLNVGMNIKSSLTATIYKKSLKLSNEERGKRASGDIVNLMSVDTQRVQELTNMGSFIWSGPFQIFLCLASLHSLLGNSMWVGVVIMIIFIPLNSFITSFMRKLQKVQMKNKDERTRVISEILNNIKSLKLYGWEKPYKEKLNFVRNEKELKNLKKMSLVQALTVFQFNVAPVLVACSSFGVFILVEKKPLTTDIVFPALSLFTLLSFPLAVLPMAITSLVEAQVALGRLTSFLTAEELQTDAVRFVDKTTKQGDVSVKVVNSTFLWQREPEYKVALANVDFVARKGELTCIVGKVGSGKSALIQSILGDLYRVDGSVTIGGNVAYVSQVPWIMNGTVKENIIFGHKYDPVFYEKTIKACALTIDFAILSNGDQTLVGEKGISLSGGQKARISLARAVYSRADVYLLDDPLAAVDEHVGKHLVDHVLGSNGLLSSKTKILATNKISVLSIADHITLLVDGVITENGTYEEVTKNPSSGLSQLIEEFGKAKEVVEEFKEEQIAIEDLISSEDNSSVEVSDVSSLRRASVSTLKSIRFSDDDKDGAREGRQQGKVKWDIYWDYIQACDPKHVAVFLIFVVIPQLLSVLGNVWLKHWSEVNSEKGYNPNPFRYLAVYFLFGIGGSIAVFLQTIILVQFCSIKASKKLHNEMTDSVFRAPMQFFETTPIGRILNRFSNDIYKIDEILSRAFSNFLVNCVKVAFTIIVICFSTWQFIVIIIPILFIYSYYQQYYMRTSRELRRLDSITRSPVFAHFQESIGGSTTIRGFGQQGRFEHINQARVDNNMSAFFPTVNANRWLAVRLEFLGSLIILGASGLTMVTLRFGHISAGTVGLSVSYALLVTQSFNWIVRMTVEVETNIVAVERVKEYSELESEAAEILEPRPAENWPQQGEIIFQDYSTRYRKDLDLVLKNINILIKPKEKVGIVGRTGAGKSSLTLALYRIIEATNGQIIIDGVSTKDIGLADLRHKLSIIPQDSQVFEGTVRENIDPTHQFTDEQIWQALELSHLKNHIVGMSDSNQGLDVPLSEGGSNLSVGQRQLMCLARALLIPSKVLVLDEATAAVDVETDKLIQETIRKEFKERTILTIAHRLNTILDSDKIIVLDKGEVKEFDSPETLLKDKNGIFYSLVHASDGKK